MIILQRKFEPQSLGAMLHANIVLVPNIRNEHNGDSHKSIGDSHDLSSDSHSKKSDSHDSKRDSRLKKRDSHS